AVNRSCRANSRHVFLFQRGSAQQVSIGTDTWHQDNVFWKSGVYRTPLLLLSASSQGQVPEMDSGNANQKTGQWHRSWSSNRIGRSAVPIQSWLSDRLQAK